MKNHVIVRYILAIGLLLAAVYAPALAGGQHIASSTHHVFYGSPPFLRVDYTNEKGRRFSEAVVYPQMLVVYSAASALFGLAAGGVLFWRRSPVPNKALQPTAGAVGLALQVLRLTSPRRRLSLASLGPATSTPMNVLRGIDLWVQGTSWVSLALSGCGICWLFFTAKQGVVESGPAILITLYSIPQEAFLILFVGVPALCWRIADRKSLPPRVIIWYLVAFLVPIVEFVVLCYLPGTSMC